MALTGIQIFKMTPKTNCRDCGCPTCMAFSMKAAQGKAELTGCPHLTEEARAALLSASAPPMAAVVCGTENHKYTLGGETVLMRHEKTFVNETRYAVTIDTAMDGESADRILSQMAAIDYERISERMFIEMIEIRSSEKSRIRLDELIRKAASYERELILTVRNPEEAAEALEACASEKPVLNGADADNYAAMNALAVKYDLVLGVTGKDLSGLHDTVEKLEKLGNKKLILSIPSSSVKEAYAMTVLIRRAALTDGDRTFGYPSFVDAGALSGGDDSLEAALGALFTSKYGSVIAFRNMNYATALPLFGLRQNLFTDPQKPMTVKTGVYPLNGADENSICLVTVDFALTYFVVSAEIERSRVPCNLCITDAAGQSVLTAWASGKLTSESIASFIKTEVETKVKSRTLAIPGKVAALKNELQKKLPEWKILVSSNEAVGIVPFLKEFS